MTKTAAMIDKCLSNHHLFVNMDLTIDCTFGETQTNYHYTFLAYKIAWFWITYIFRIIWLESSAAKIIFSKLHLKSSGLIVLSMISLYLQNVTNIFP